MIGLDASPSMLAIAAQRVRRRGGAGRAGRGGRRGPLPLEDGAVDLAVATQVYEYVPDMPAALAEVRRVLAPGGRLLVLDTDWDSLVWHSPDEGLTRRVMAAWDEHLAHRDLPRRLPGLLRGAGLALESASIVPLLNVGYARETYSAGILELIAGFVPGRGGVSAGEAEAWASALREMGTTTSSR